MRNAMTDHAACLHYLDLHKRPSARRFSALQTHPHLLKVPRRQRVDRCTRVVGHGGSQASEHKHVVVVGGGWAGFGAAYALLKAGIRVTILDASKTPGGLSSGWRTAGGRSVEAGIKGFWWQYSNINKLVADLGIDNPFTDWTRSSFWSPAGLEVQSPIFHHQPRLPTPLGSFLYTSPYFTRLPMWDRLTALPLLGPLLEFDFSEEAYRQYDQMSASQLFASKGVSKRLIREFLEPMLLVTLFAPASQLSAAAALAALYYFVLAHQADFDVRWCKGPVAERLFKPWVAHLQDLGGHVLGGRRVREVKTAGLLQGAKLKVSTTEGEEEQWDADAVVFAVGVKAMQGIVAASPDLAACPELARVKNLSTVDVAAVRLWLDRRVPQATPSNVVAGVDPGVGATFFDLNALQEEYRLEEGSVVEVDYYNIAPVAGLSEDQLIQTSINDYLGSSSSAYCSCQILDASVLRFPGAVTAFKPGSHQHMPPTTTSLPGIYMAGDWVAQGPGTHGAKGLSQEKAYVTGLQAGNQAAQQLDHAPKIPVIPVEADEPHMMAAKSASRFVRSNVPLSHFRA